MANQQERSLSEIEQRYPNQWVLIEETNWDMHGNPTGGVVKAASLRRSDLRVPLQECHKQPHMKTFVFYTGDKIPADITVVL
jgi:hypothetical protein